MNDLWIMVFMSGLSTDVFKHPFYLVMYIHVHSCSRAKKGEGVKSKGSESVASIQNGAHMRIACPMSI